MRQSGSAQPANERRLVTILFSDIKGSTALAEHMDPEEVLEIINGAFEALIAPIYRHEGTLARLMGNAILAFFGAPVAHEDDPHRAIRAALEIQAGVCEYAARLAEERGNTGFNVRVGINTGLVVVGEVGSDLRVEYTAIGDAINTAARMEQNASVGGILISQDTYQHVRGLFEFEAQPPLMVKGKSEPIQTYVVTGLRSRAGLRAPQRGLEGVQTPLVGRETELLWLKNIYQDALDEAQTRLVTVVGEAGVGKSRLLDEFLPGCAATPMLCTLLGRGAPESQSHGFGLWRSLFSSYLEIQENDSATQVSERFQCGLAPDLLPGQAEVVARLLGFETAYNLPSAENLEIQGQDCIEDYFRSITSRQPVLVILDDIHWADAASLNLADRLVNALPSANSYSCAWRALRCMKLIHTGAKVASVANAFNPAEACSATCAQVRIKFSPATNPVPMILPLSLRIATTLVLISMSLPKDHTELHRAIMYAFIALSKGTQSF